jgi:Cu-processing system permease protein
MNIFRIAFIAIRELLYERVFYIFLSFSLMSLGLSLLLGQMTYAEQSKLTLDFMLAGIQISMTLFSVFVGISLFQKEIQTGSVSMVLSKPISRGTFLLGKFLGQVTVQLVVTALMAAFTIWVCRSYGLVSIPAVLQCVFLISLEVCLLTAVTYFFAVNSGAMTTAVVGLCFFAIGHLRAGFAKNFAAKDGTSFIWTISQSVIPDLEVFNSKALASYGLLSSTTEVTWALTYALICIVFFLSLAVVCFNQKDILT